MDTRIRCVLAVAAAAGVVVASSHAVLIDTCGVVAQGPLCVLIHTDGGPSYVLVPNAQGYEPGQRIRVVGDLDTACVSTCPLGSGCIRFPQITLCPPSCRADFDGSGLLGVQDIFSFLAAYFGQVGGPSPPGADFDGNGSITVNDIFSYLVAYFSGCP